MWPWLTVDQRILRTAKQFAKEDRRLRPFSLASTLENYKKLFGEHVDDCAGHLGWLNCDGPTLEKLIDRSFPASQPFYGIEIERRRGTEIWAFVNDDGPGGCYKFDPQGHLSNDFVKTWLDLKEQTGSISDDMLTPQKFVLSEDCEFTQYVDRHGHAHPLESARKERKWGNNPFALFHIELPRRCFSR
ncbi:hypothetical protein Psta_0170 [Pirellula staleyi DSM 6068]|uniref:Uncharacterized protein n=1 Tax=Pirellula staleyi (strain ATCC 27377 / DSM 6068 / ICPB 4128) TaxID=530564 RepID=D2R0J8_PIRSD|nr:hypothetical protein [Pirellula staleyi]ADB14866.1 hypothetical protein Psta_0170 [Pirellula staleyi DSM 6068]